MRYINRVFVEGGEERVESRGGGGEGLRDCGGRRGFCAPFDGLWHSRWSYEGSREILEMSGGIGARHFCGC